MTKRQYWLWPLMLLAMVVTMGSLAACGDDEDDEGGSGAPEKGFTLVGKTFYRNKTEYSDIGEKYVEYETIYFKTATTCVRQVWGSDELIYNDGSKEKNRFDSGEVTGTYTISGNKVTAIFPNGEFGGQCHYTIANGGLDGFKLTSDDNAKTPDDQGGGGGEPTKPTPEGNPGTSDMFGYYVNSGLRTVVERNASDLEAMGFADRSHWTELEMSDGGGLQIADDHTINTLRNNASLTAPSGNAIQYASTTYNVKTSRQTATYTFYFYLDSPTFYGTYAVQGNTINILTKDGKTETFTYSDGTIVWANSTFTKVK